MHSSTLLREMWPMLATMRILGWLPIQRHHDTDMLHLGKSAIVYSCIILILQAGPAFYLFAIGIKVSYKYINTKM
jgi:hypothetical protein